MKYCINYTKTSKILNEVDEITIRYNHLDSTLFELLNKDKRINIAIDENNIEDFRNNNEIINIQKYKQDNNNLKIYIKLKIKNDDLIEDLKSANIPYFLEVYAFNWDLFWGLLNLGVSDIYITEDLGFELNKIAEIAHNKEIQIRAFPNIAQSQWKTTDGIKQFFIRPEDVSAYEDYIDILEFYGEQTNQDLFYSIYAKDKKWFGPLQEIIIGLNSDLDSRFMLPDFGKHRIACKKKCEKGEPCNICNQIIELSKLLKEQDYYIGGNNKETKPLRTEEEFKKDIIDKI